MTADEFFRLFEVQDQDFENIRELATALDGKIDEFVDRLYVYMRAAMGQDFDLHFPDDVTLTRAQKAARRGWQEFLAGRWDEAYVNGRIRIGEVHAQLQIEPRHYLATMDKSVELLIDLAQGAFAKDKLAKYEQSLRRVARMEGAFVVDIYSRRTGDIIAQQSRALTDMSTPITAIWDGILMLPVVGIVDSRRAQDIMQRMLEQIFEKRATVFILDISGVAVVDTAVANHLIRMNKAARLMGSYTIVSGLSPSVAQTIVELGIDVGDLRTTGNLQDALRIAFEHVGVEQAVASGAK